MSSVSLSGTPVLQTGRLTLRAPERQDWEAFATFIASDRAGFVGGPIGRRDGWRSFGHLIGHWVLRGWGMFIITEKGSDRALGMVGPWCPETWPEAEIGWSLWEREAEGRGIAQEAAVAARAHAYKALGWRTAVSYIDPSNVRSIALAERVGAVIDPEASHPSELPCLVYRHPAPEAVA